MHRHLPASFRQILMHTALKILARHQVCLRIFALSATKFARKSAHISYEHKLSLLSECKMCVCTRQQHLLLRRNGKRVKKNIKKKCGFESSPEHKPLFADAFILSLRNQIQCSFTQNVEIQRGIVLSCP